MPPETRLQRRKNLVTDLLHRLTRTQSLDDSLLAPFPQGTASLSFGSLPSAAEGTLTWDSAYLDLRGSRPPTGGSQVASMDLLNVTDRQGGPSPATNPSLSPSSRRSGVPTPTPRQFGASRASPLVEHSHSADAWSRPLQLYVTETRLAQVIADLMESTKNADTRTEQAAVARTAEFISAMEQRVIKAVTEEISSDYSHIGIQAIERNASIRNELQKLTQTVNTSVADSAQSLEKVAQVSTVVESLRLSLGEVQGRFGNWSSLDAAVALVRAEQQAAMNTCVQAIRALSVQLGNLQQAHVTGAHRTAAGECSSDVPPPLSIAELRRLASSADNGRRAMSPPVPTADPPHEGGQATGNQMPPSERPRPSLPPSPPARDNFHARGQATPPQRPPLSPHSSTSSGTTAYLHKLARLKRKIRLTCDLLISIMRIDPTQVTSKSQAVELVNYDLPQLLTHRSTLRESEREWDRLEDMDEDLADLIDSTSQRSVGWERAVIDLQKRFFMHLKSSSSLLKKVDLSPFSGSPDAETVFQFLDTFHRLADTCCDPLEQADLLYNSYLSQEIQLEVFSFKTDIARIEDWLIAQYGDLRRIADIRVARVASLKHPAQGQPTAVHIEYFKVVHQLLIHLESLSYSNRVDQQEIAHIIHNASWVTQLVSRLPEETIVDFTKLLEKEPRIPPPSGKRHFDLLRDLIDSTWRQLNTAQRIRSARDPGIPPADARKLPTSRSANNSTSAPARERKGPNSPKAAPRQRAKATSSSCPFHDPGVSVKHSIGQCFTFFRSSCQQRIDLCKKAKVCFTCLSADCIRISLGACISSQFPAEIVCPECSQSKSKRPFNVLLCTNSAHTKPPLRTVQDALKRFFKPFDLNLVDHLKSQFNLASALGSVLGLNASHSKGPSKSSAFNPAQKVPAFDTTLGLTTTSPKCVREESSEDTVYIFQTVNIAGHQALVFYDSGATGNLIRGAFA